ncbi:CYFA0S11e00364g1_1 [Cyberlindnera fabianii]|uniref:UDP-N-acetylglucosamine transferase subunit ALG13 n=1 Tax=Cyberlindnera fabianii TaxID=36022 RepID=A0A061B881_CYBFA|nr:CYFA0S11e00364g1_1 [Cyberlindnera fabianii]
MRSVFVTTGATVTFERLVKLSLDPKVLDLLSLQGYNKVIVQYGKSARAKELFEDSIKNLNGSYQGEECLYKNIIIEGIPFTADVDSVISGADLVLSHAGTGSILDTLRLKKKLVVVINDQLMDNHQEEVANSMMAGSHLIKSEPSLEKLLEALTLTETHDFTPLPTPKPNMIEQILQEL